MKTIDRISPPSLADPVFCVVGDTLCRVVVFSDAEWERLELSTRPAPAKHCAGLGWVAAVLGTIPG